MNEEILSHLAITPYDRDDRCPPDARRLGERDLISERTKEGLAAAKAKGKRLGRPKGALGTSRLDGKEQDIRALLGKDVSKASIAKILDVSRSALYHFIQTRKIAPG